MSTETPTTQSLADRVESEKATVEAVETKARSPLKTALMIAGAIAFLVGIGLLAYRFLSTTAANNSQDPAAAPSSAPEDANAATAAAAVSEAPIGAATATKAATVVAEAALSNAAQVSKPAMASPGIVVDKNGAGAAPAAAAKMTAAAAAAAAAAPAAPEEKQLSVADLANETVPWWQREFAKLPAMEACEHGKYGDNIYPYDHRNPMYDAGAYDKMNTDVCGPEEDNLYTKATVSQGDSASEIYARARPNGIALLNRGAIRDPEKMLPRATSGDEKLRRFQVGASIADIQKHLPKTTDLMKMARDRPSGLSFQIPLEKPPLYTEGINCERRARIPTRASDKNQLFCINPIDPRELYDYRPHPLLDSVLASGGRHPQGGGFAGGAPDTGAAAASSAAASSAAAASTTA